MALDKQSLQQGIKRSVRELFIDMLWNTLAVTASTVVAVLYVGSRFGFGFEIFIDHIEDFIRCVSMLMLAFFIHRGWPKIREAEWFPGWNEFWKSRRDSARGDKHE